MRVICVLRAVSFSHSVDVFQFYKFIRRFQFINKLYQFFSFHCNIMNGPHEEKPNGNETERNGSDSGGGVETSHFACHPINISGLKSGSVSVIIELYKVIG